jgi:hypothetical protein
MANLRVLIRDRTMGCKTAKRQTGTRAMAMSKIEDINRNVGSPTAKVATTTIGIIATTAIEATTETAAI